MENSFQDTLNNLKAHLALGIKESCITTDLRIYNVANGIHDIIILNRLHGDAVRDALPKIFDKSIKESIDLGCDLSIIVKGLMLGAFRGSPFVRDDANKKLQTLIELNLRNVLLHKGEIKDAVQGILAATLIISNQFKLDAHQGLTKAKEVIIAFVQKEDPKILDKIKESLAQDL